MAGEAGSGGGELEGDVDGIAGRGSALLGGDGAPLSYLEEGRGRVPTVADHGAGSRSGITQIHDVSAGADSVGVPSAALPDDLVAGLDLVGAEVAVTQVDSLVVVAAAQLVIIADSIDVAVDSQSDAAYDTPSVVHHVYVDVAAVHGILGHAVNRTGIDAVAGIGAVSLGNPGDAAGGHLTIGHFAAVPDLIEAVTAAVMEGTALAVPVQVGGNQID
ncbi:MAG: hypothetical protein K2P22_01775, partial [Lachnospiraceae bacterium]|nr:hypothetical protein [Lachnospiraceae bacterium]